MVGGVPSGVQFSTTQALSLAAPLSPSIQKEEAEGSEVQGQPQLQSESEAMCVRPLCVCWGERSRIAGPL